jgi:ribose transport system substrate-binding protein
MPSAPVVSGMSTRMNVRRSNTLGTLDKGLTVLETLETAGSAIALHQIAARTGIQRLAVYRILTTLEERGYVRRLSDKRYQAVTRRRSVVGYMAPLTGSSFREAVAAGLTAAARRSRVELQMLDNPEYDQQTSIRNARELVEADVDLVIFFEPLEAIGHAVADLFLQAEVPFITVEIGIESGVYYGANNYQAGKMAGQALGRFATKEWKGYFDSAVLIESSLSTQRVQARLAGALEGLRETVGAIPNHKLIRFDGRAHRTDTYHAAKELLSGRGARGRLLISAFNDVSAIGALEAIREAGREEDVAIVGQNGSQESWRELVNPRSRFIASVAYFPEKYGQDLIDTALSLIARQHTPPAVYTQHALLTHQTILRYYPGAASQEMPDGKRGGHTLRG